MRFSGFDWDTGNWPKCGKHGVRKDEIEFVFHGEPRVAPDWDHSDAEDRFIAVGTNPGGRGVFVGFTFRGAGAERSIRPVTARSMHEKEFGRYVEKSARTEE